MSSKTLDYRSPGIRPRPQPRSGAVSIVASTLAIVIGLAAYFAIFAGPGTKTMFHGAAMGFILFFFCGPLFIIAAIAAVIAARNPRGQKAKLVIAWSLVAVQASFWVYMIAGSIIDASSSSAPHGVPGGL
jgi:hypothetical protein